MKIENRRSSFIKVSFACLLAIVWSANLRADNEIVDLILVAGQSNAVGFHARASELPEDPRDAQVMFWWRGGDPPPDSGDSSFNQEWVPLQTQPKGNPTGSFGNFGQDEGGFGPEIGFARTLLDEEPHRPLAIVKVAYNATGIASWQPGGAIYSTLISETNLAIQKAEAMGITLRPRAFLWCQGEGDAGGNTATYRSRFETMISALRNELNARELIALLGFNTKFGNGWDTRTEPRWENQRIIDAQIQVAQNSDYAVRVEDWGCEVANSAHFSAAGTVELGERYAAALLQKEAELGFVDIPRLVVAHIDGETTVTEGGDSDTYTVVINRAPGEAVTVSLTVDDQVTVTPTSLTFISSDWDIPQVVTVTAVDDDIHELIHTGTITHTSSSSDPEWDGLTRDFVVTVIDNDNTPPEVDAGPDRTVHAIQSIPWTPEFLSLEARYDAADESTITKDRSNRVSQWRDRSGNDHHVNQTSDSAKPVSGTRTLNGLNALAFSGSANQWLRSNENISGQPLTAFAVAQFDSAGTHSTVFDGSGSRCMLRRTNNDVLALYAGSWLDGAATTAEAVLASVEFNAVSSFIRKNGGTAVTGNPGTEGLTSGLTIGNISGNEGDGWRMDGLISELIFVSGSLSDADRQRAEGYLAHKWGLQANFPADHPYKSTAPETVIATATLNGSASDADGDTLVTTWSMVSGPGPVSFEDSAAVNTTATFNFTGTYVLRLTVFDGQDTALDEVTITIAGTAQETYSDWISGFDLGGQTAFDEDYNNDGVPNGLKYFFGIDPPTPSPGLSVLVPDISDANQFSFTHPMAENLTTGISAEYRWTKDLSTFHMDGTSDADGTTVTFVRGELVEGMVTVTATINGTPTDRIFVVLVVTQDE